MEEIRSQFKCPQCAQVLLTGEPEQCSHCGATLSSDLLFSEEKTEKMNEQERISELQRREENAQPVPGEDANDLSNSIDVIESAIDIVGDVVGGAIDIAGSL